MLATTSITYKFNYTPDPALSSQDRLIAFQTHFRAQPAPADFSDPAFIAVLRTYARVLREARTRTLHEYAVAIPSETRRACCKRWAERFDTNAVREHIRRQREQKDRDQEDLRINRHRRAATRAQERFRISLISLAALQARIAKLEQQIQDARSSPLTPENLDVSCLASTTQEMGGAIAGNASPSKIAHEMGERKSSEALSVPARVIVLDDSSRATQSDSPAPISTSASTSTTATPPPTRTPSTPPSQKSPDASAPSASSDSREIASDQPINSDPGALHPDPTRLRNPDP